MFTQEHKEALKRLSKGSHKYFEVVDPELVGMLDTLLQDGVLHMIVNKRCYLLQQNLCDYQVTFTNLSTIKTVNLADL